MNNDKENTITMEDYSSTGSPKPLQPISPNRAPNIPGAKANFLVNDSIDSHFDTLHDSNKNVQHQLYNIEILSKQTKVDLDQLIERAKNNHANLNKLLESVVKYSNDKLTETIVTKDDFNTFVRSIDPILEHSKHASNEQIVEFLAKPENNPAAQTERLLSSIQADNKRIQDILSHLDKSQFKASEVIDPIVAELKAVQLDTKSQTLLEEILHKMNREASSYIEQEDFQNNTSRDLRDILARVHQMDISVVESELKTHNQSVIEKFSHLETVIQDQTTKIQNLSAQINKQHTITGLESKIDTLNSKYETLCLLYKQKYNELMKLKDEFDKLKEETDKSRMAINDKENVNTYEKVESLHVSKLNTIGNKLNHDQSRKRVVSTPLVNPTTNNSDSESF